MDEDAAKLEREEKRRLRRERIKRILEDDTSPAPARRTKDVNGLDTGRTERTSATSRRTRETAGSSSVSRTRSREDVGDAPARSSRSRRVAAESSPTRAGETERSSSPSTLRERREARRKRNQEHDITQNKLTLENDTVNKEDLSGHSVATVDTTGRNEEHVSRSERNRTKEAARKDSEEFKISLDATGKEKDAGEDMTEKVKVDDSVVVSVKEEQIKNGEQDLGKIEQKLDTMPRVEASITAEVEGLSECVNEKKVVVGESDQEGKEVNGMEEVKCEGTEVGKVDGRDREKETIEKEKSEVDGDKKEDVKVMEDVEKSGELAKTTDEAMNVNAESTDLDKGTIDEVKGDTVDALDQVVTKDSAITEGSKEFGTSKLVGEPDKPSDSDSERLVPSGSGNEVAVDSAALQKPGADKGELKESTKDDKSLKATEKETVLTEGTKTEDKLTEDTGKDKTPKDAKDKPTEDKGKEEAPKETKGKPADVSTKKEAPLRKGKLKLDGDSWMKSARKKKEVVGRDRGLPGGLRKETGPRKDRLKQESLTNKEKKPDLVAKEDKSLEATEKDETDFVKKDDKSSTTKDEMPKETEKKKDKQTDLSEGDANEKAKDKQVEATATVEPPTEITKTEKEVIKTTEKDETPTETAKATEGLSEATLKEETLTIKTEETKQTEDTVKEETPTETKTKDELTEAKMKDERLTTKTEKTKEQRADTTKTKDDLTDGPDKKETTTETAKPKDEQREAPEKKEAITETTKTMDEHTVIPGKTETSKQTAKDKDKPTEPSTKKEAPTRKGKLKIEGDSWNKSARKKKGAVDRDRAVELTVLGRTGKLKDKLKSCEKRDVETANAWKKEVKKTAKKQKSLDEETEQELRELSRRRQLKERVQQCNEMDKESAEAWTPTVKKGAKKYKPTDEEAEEELKELAKANALKKRIKECEKKDQETADAWKKIVKEGEAPKVAEVLKNDEDIKDFSESGRLKNLIASCSERDEKKDESWKAAKEKTKALTEEEEAELREMNLKALKTQIINTFEEREKDSAEAAMKRVKPGEGPRALEELTNEELKELVKTVNVKERIKLKVEEEKKQPEEIPKGIDLNEEEELKEINLKGRIEAYKEESKKVGTEGIRKDRTGSAEGFLPIKEDTLGSDHGSPVKGITETNKDTRVRASSKDSDRVSPTKRDTGRTSPTKKDKIGRTSPTKGDKIGRTSPHKDAAGRTSPTKRDAIGSPSKDIGDRGRTSSTKGDATVKDASVHSDKAPPTKKDTSGKSSPLKEPPDLNRTSAAKRDIKGRTSPTKGVGGKSKLGEIQAKLYDGGKAKIKSKRESLDRLPKSAGIKDKIAACKQRDQLAPVRKLPVEKTPAKPKATAEQRNAVPDLIPVNRAPDPSTTVDEEAAKDEVVEVDIKGKMSYWESPKTDGEDTSGDENAPKESERPALLNLGTEKQGWISKKRKLNAAEFIKTLLNAKCRRRDLKDIQDIKSDTKKYLVAKKGEENVKSLSVSSEHEEESGHVEKTLDKALEKNVEKLNEKNLEKSAAAPVSDSLDDFSFDDVVNPDEVKQLRGFSDFRRQVRPAKRRAAKSNPLRKLQERKDVKSEADLFDEIDGMDDDEEEEILKPTSVGRLGKPIEPGDRKTKENAFSKDALAGLSAKEDVSKINLKKTAKSRKGVSQEKSHHDGTAPVMLMQIKGHRHLQTRLVKPSAESMNSGDSFVCVTGKYLYVWHGKDSNVMKKSKASELSNRILQYKLLNCSATTVTIIKDSGVNIGTGLRRTFWDMLGDKGAIKSAKEVPKDGDYEKGVVSTNRVFVVDTSSEPAKLEKLPELCGKIPSIKMLDSDKAFVFDFGTEVYSWLGRTCDSVARTTAVKLGLDMFKEKFHTENSLNPITPNNASDGKGTSLELERPSWAVFGRMTERAETILFEEKFLDWPDPKMKVKLDQQKDLLNKNLSGGYAKRKAKLEVRFIRKSTRSSTTWGLKVLSEWQIARVYKDPCIEERSLKFISTKYRRWIRNIVNMGAESESEVQIIELVAYDGAKMAEKPPPVNMVLEGVNVGRGRGSYDEIERRSLSVTTNSVTVYHSSDKEYRQLEEKEWGHFYSAESYVIRWSYCVKASGVRSLKGGESKHDNQGTGRDQIAYFFWHGKDCSASGKGTSALATIELDSDKSPQIMVDQGDESACFLNMFDGQMTVHHGKLNDKTPIEEDNVLMYCVLHEDERETSFVQIEARSSNLRSRSSFIVVIVEKSIGICVWHGSKSTKEKKAGALRGAKRLTVWYQGLFNVSKCDIVELDEGQEENMFWEVLDGKSDYGSLLQLDRKCDNQLRLFYFTSAEGPFLAKEVLDPTKGELLSPYPFIQSELYSTSQPALFLLDAVHAMYLWQGWWPINPAESDSVTTTGSAEFRWHRDRRLAMQTTQSYADVVGRQMAKSFVVNAGLEPVEFRALFPFWEDHHDVTRINLQDGKISGEKASMVDLLAKLSRDRYTLAELQVRPLPEGVDPSKMEIYLSDEEFKSVFNMSKDEFTKLPKWKKVEQRKNAGLF